MRFYAYHGVLKEERIIGAWFEVSLEINYDSYEACSTDDIKFAVDYSKLSMLVEEEMKKESKLIEHVAKRISDKSLLDFPSIHWLNVTITKCKPPVKGELEVSFSYEQSR